MMANMSLTVSRIHDLVIEQLSRREMRVLSLIVAIRKNLEMSDGFKGDLSASVKSVLRTLVASRTVAEVEGMYSLVSLDEKTSVAAGK